MKTFLIIVPDGGMLFEAAGVADILMQANRLHTDGASQPRYQITLATTQPHPRVIHGQSGLNLLADFRLPQLDPREPRDTIMITGRGMDEEEGTAVVDWLRLAAPHARRVVSHLRRRHAVGTSGLARRASRYQPLAAVGHPANALPRVQVEHGPLYIQDGPVWTSGGVSSGFDLTLALVEDDYGFTLARDVAQDLVMYLHRPGGQLQFSRFHLQPANSSGPISELQSWILANLAGDLSVEKLAARVAMSPRNFTRVFTRETGAPPARYVAEARLAEARNRPRSRPATRWSAWPKPVVLAAALICGAFLSASFT